MSQEIRRSRNYLQLFNSSHKNDLGKLFQDAKLFCLTENANEEDDSLKQIDEDFLSDDDEQIPNLPVDVTDKSIPGVRQETVTCTTCGTLFTDVTEHRLHYRLDWHRYNLKRKILYGQPPVTEEEFDEMMDDLSSIEGSDCEDKETTDLPISRLLEKVSIVNEEKVEKLSKSQTKLSKSPRVYLENIKGEIFSLFKSVVHLDNDNEKINEGCNNGAKTLTTYLNSPPMWAIIMVSGGHFAAAVFEGATVLLHKTFHSYTVRAKQGGSQGAQDNKSGTSHPKSAGASLRRYNEASFTQHIQDLLDSWKEKLSRCSLIFYRAASSSANSLFGGKSPALQRSNPKLRNIPFPSMRPTLKEVKRAHSILSSVHIHGNRDDFIAIHFTPKTKDCEETTRPKRSKRKNPHIDRAKSRSPVKREEPERPVSSPEIEDGVDYTLEESYEERDLTELMEYEVRLTSEDGIRNVNKSRKPRSRKPKAEEFPKPLGIVGDLMDSILSNDMKRHEDLLNELKTQAQKDDPSFLGNINQPINAESFTILHVAVNKGLMDTIWSLLECGCDPAIKDKNGKYAYNHAESKDCRMIFRRFRAQYPDKFDYEKAQVPVPLSEEQEQEKLEKKRALNKLKREKEKLKKLEKKEKEKETEEKDRFLNLSDREKRALAAERRILGMAKRNCEKAPILVRCFECASDMTGKVPFEYNQNVFCSSKCLVVHRKKFPTVLTA